MVCFRQHICHIVSRHEQTTSHPETASHFEFIGLRMPSARYHKTEEDPRIKPWMIGGNHPKQVQPDAACGKHSLIKQNYILILSAG